MENLNAEQIKKELALFIDDMPVSLHLGLKKTVKLRDFLQNVLTIFDSLEVELKAVRSAANAYKIYIVELTEEIERLEKLCALRDQDCKDTQDLLYKAEAKNAELEKKYALAVAEREANVKGFSETLAVIYDDTVRKMQDRLLQEIETGLLYEGTLLHYLIQKIAKELTLAKEERDAENEKEEAF